MSSIFNLEPPKFDVAARFYNLLEEIRNQPQDPTVVHDAALAWLKDGQRQLEWTIEDQLIAASKAPPVWLTDPDKKLRIYMFGLPPALANYRNEIMSHLSCSMEEWGLDAHIEKHPLSVQGQTTFQISIKFKTLPGYEAASYVPIVVGDYSRQHDHLLIPNKSSVTLQPVAAIPHTPTPLNDPVSVGPHDPTSPPLMSPSSSRNALSFGGLCDRRPPKTDICPFVDKIENADHDAIALENKDPPFDFSHTLTSSAHSIDGKATSHLPAAKLLIPHPLDRPRTLNQNPNPIPVQWPSKKLLQ